MEKYVCDLCGYVYDPAENDGVAFEDLPEDYVCPLCGAGKDSFSKEYVSVKRAQRRSGSVPVAFLKMNKIKRRYVNACNF